MTTFMQWSLVLANGSLKFPSRGQMSAYPQKIKWRRSYRQANSQSLAGIDVREDGGARAYSQIGPECVRQVEPFHFNKYQPSPSMAPANPLQSANLVVSRSPPSGSSLNQCSPGMPGGIPDVQVKSRSETRRRRPGRRGRRYILLLNRQALQLGAGRRALRRKFERDYRSTRVGRKLEGSPGVAGRVGSNHSELAEAFQIDVVARVGCGSNKADGGRGCGAGLGR